MKFSLLDNGVDSLKTAHNDLNEFNNLAEGGHYLIKNATIFLSHGIELLLKFILKENSQSFMFENIKMYMNAKERLSKDKNGAKTVFDVEPKLRTVCLTDALKRIEYLCDIELPTRFTDTVLHVNKIRNNIMHYAIELDEQETDTLIKHLKVCYDEAVDFFCMHIEDLEGMIDEPRFELSYEEYEEQLKEEYGENYAEMQREDALLDLMEMGYEDKGEGRW
ncbi:MULTISPECIES: hypothetical protein [Sporolactobacillus]|uniref:DUF4145 domain-containing protein n=1 Tax=Sporolactobacillus spathodeae TaxID=1465502 RepID=A0ABS2Q9I3_9BACL|nr:MULTISPECIES: hypothetical protein [Sporolactobacillus]MBM7657834.1 hypothetical protein [Sporolactobacillus spathodeae]GEB78552.1 hypothetical protein SIN01_28970 [Sporolactobacillus inulinus]